MSTEDASARWRAHVTVNPDILLGKPIIQGTRISVEHLLEVLACGWTMEDILASYPHLTQQDVLAALAFVAEFFVEQQAKAILKIRT